MGTWPSSPAIPAAPCTTRPLSTTPPPSVGGVCLTAMLRLLLAHPEVEIGAVTAGLESIQASATCAGVTPSAATS